MKAVACLIRIYFMGVPLLRWFSMLGLGFILLAVVAMTSLSHRFEVQAGAFVCVTAFFLGSAMMPVIFGTLARSRQIHMLPFGRTKLLASALITTALVTIPLPVLSVLAMIASMPRTALQSQFYVGGTLADFLQAVFFWQMYVAVFFACTWLYVALWFAISSRTTAGLIRSLVVLIAILILPPASVRMNPDASLVGPLIATGISWVVLGAYALFAHRLRNTIPTKLSISPPMVSLLRGGARYSSGREIDLLLRTGRPWILAIAQVFPILLATRFITTPSTWLFYLTIFSTVSGAIAGSAAVRSRSIWLRAGWSRTELFRHAERRFWVHNSYPLGMLLLLLIGIGSYSGLEPSLIAFGMPLLIVGTAVSTYLGLMMTKGMRWPEIILAISVMLLLMTAAILAADPASNRQIIVALQLLLTAIAFACRFLARRRWTELDWMLCRPRSEPSELKLA
jgi:hypothetical protein